MSTQKTSTPDGSDREIIISRVFDAPRELVWQAMTDPQHVVHWWGPRGFTTTVKKMDVQPGGVWQHTMHGPDGTDYPNKSVFKEIVKPERIVFSHGGGRKGGPGASFRATWSFYALSAGKTKVTIHMIFPSAADRDFVVKEFGAIEGGRQTLARLAEHLPKMQAGVVKRRLIMFNMVSLDGFFADANQGIDWHVTDEEFGAFATEQSAAHLDSVDVILFGRVTYQLMAGYWPTEAAVKGDPVVARFMNEKPKLVFSRTLKKADWANTRLVKEDAVAVVRALKQQPGKDLMIFGSAKLATRLTQHGLIDEYQVMVNPVVLGRGQPLFQGVKTRVHLQLMNSRAFKAGNVLLTYRPRLEDRK